MQYLVMQKDSVTNHVKNDLMVGQTINQQYRCHDVLII